MAEPRIYRNLGEDAWGSVRLNIAGTPVTFWDDVPVQIGGYQLTEPYSFGPADFEFPQIANTDALPEWLVEGALARLIRVNAAGEYVRDLWRGFITQINPKSTGTSVHCDGEASGRLEAMLMMPRLFVREKDVGRWLFDAFKGAGIPALPSLGYETGVEVDTRGRSGSRLSYCDSLLADAQWLNGDMLTVLYDADEGKYRFQLKDRETINATVDNAAPGVELDVSSDLMEKPTTIYGEGRAKNGMVWVNAKYPGLIQGVTPPFPGPLNHGDSGDDVEVLQFRLIGAGYLDREDAAGGFDDDTEDAVKELQRDAGLTRTGVVNSATWDALWDLDDTGYWLGQSFQAPLAEHDEVRRWKRSANGARIAENPDFNPDRVDVQMNVDHGSGTSKKEARAWSQRQLDRIHNGDTAWTGTLRLSTDAIAGDYDSGEPTDLMSRLTLKPGMNVKVRHFLGGHQRFHVSGINVDAELNVTLAVDTKARDLRQVAEIIQRRAESRDNVGRDFRRPGRRTDANQRVKEFDEVCGKIWNRVECPADEWTVFPVPVGQSGTIHKVQLEVVNDTTEYILGASMAPAAENASWWGNHLAENPFAGAGLRAQRAAALAVADGIRATADAQDRSVTSDEQDIIDAKEALADSLANQLDDAKWWEHDAFTEQVDSGLILGAWGTFDQPCGYFPRNKRDEDDHLTGAPTTGRMRDDAGVSYYDPTWQGVAWVAIYPQQACVILPQRIFWPTLEPGM